MCIRDRQCSLLGQMLDYKSEMALTLGSGGYAVMTVEQIPQEIPDYVTVSASAWQGFYNLEIGIEKLGTLFDWCRNQFPQKDRNPKDFILLAQKANKTNARDVYKRQIHIFPWKDGMEMLQMRSLILLSGRLYINHAWHAEPVPLYVRPASAMTSRITTQDTV